MVTTISNLSDVKIFSWHSEGVIFSQANIGSTQQVAQLHDKY